MMKSVLFFDSFDYFFYPAVKRFFAAGEDRKFCDYFVVFIGNNIRYGRDFECRGQLGRCIRIHFDKAETGIGGGNCLEYGRKLTAGAAPVGPEIHHHQLVAGRKHRRRQKGRPAGSKERLKSERLFFSF